MRRKGPVCKNRGSQPPHFLEGPDLQLRANRASQPRLFSFQLFPESIRKILAGEERGARRLKEKVNRNIRYLETQRFNVWWAQAMKE